MHPTELPVVQNRWIGRPIAVVLAACACASIAAPTAAGAARPSFTSQSASAIIAQARAAMSAERSVTAIGSSHVKISGLGKVDLREKDYSGATSGRQLLQMTSSAVPSRSELPSATTLDVKGALYVKGTAAFWSNAAGTSDTQSTQLANRWVQIPSSSSLYGTTAADLTMSSVIHDLFNARTFHKGRVRTVDGVRSISISYTTTGYDAGRATCVVALGGKHLPVSVTISGITLRLESWGKTEAVDAPHGAIPLPTLIPPSSPGAGIAT